MTVEYHPTPKTRILRRDMTGAIRLGDATEDTPMSICWYCKRPVGDCQWLMRYKPYEGTEYYSFFPRLKGRTPMSPMEHYNIQSCPKHVE